jgi:hypothetical protein
LAFIVSTTVVDLAAGRIVGVDGFAGLGVHFNVCLF